MKKVLTVLLCVLCVASLFANGSQEVASSSEPELKGPGNVTLKRLGYNAGFDVNTDYMVPVIEEVTG